MSKNRREKLTAEIAQTESRIEQLEADLQTVEAQFSKPAPDMNWEESHRRHAEIQKSLETLYSQLGKLSELLD
jgi:prefoldin subunit 5